LRRELRAEEWIMMRDDDVGKEGRKAEGLNAIDLHHD